MKLLTSIFRRDKSKKELLDASFQKLVKEERQANNLSMKRTFTRRFYMMILSGVVFVIGLALFVIYFFTLIQALGGPGIIMIIIGIFAFYHYWKQEEDFSVDYIAGGMKDTVNSLSIYPDKVIFEDVDKPKGFPWKGIGLKGVYYVNIWDIAGEKLIPFILPDQQYCDPNVFAQRVLGLPAHKKIFERKPKLIQKLKTALLVLAIAIVWLLILTTTGG